MEETNKYRLVGAGVMLLFTLVILPLVFHRNEAPPRVTSRPEVKVAPKIVEPSHFQSSDVAEVDLDQAPQTLPLNVQPLEPLKTTPEPLKVKEDVKVDLPFEKNADFIDPLTSAPEKNKPKAKVKPASVKPKPLPLVISKPIKTEKSIAKSIVKKPIKPLVAALKSKPKPATSAAGWVIQVASLSDNAHATRLTAELKKKGFPAFTQVTKTPHGAKLTRVLIGPDEFRSKADARLKQVTAKAQVKAIVVRYPISARG